MRFQKHENIKKISGKWKTWNMILKKTVIIVKTGNANSPISEKTKDSNWISPDGDSLSMP